MEKNEKNSLIVACSKANFEKMFIDENAWYPIPIAKNKVLDIKYVFSYQKFPIAAITHVAEVKEINQIPNSRKYKILFKEKAKKISPIEMGEDQRNVPQNPRYSNNKLILNSTSMDYIYGE